MAILNDAGWPGACGHYVARFVSYGHPGIVIITKACIMSHPTTSSRPPKPSTAISVEPNMQPPSSPTSVKLEIGGQFFYLGLKYKEGDVITAAEAAALDKARADNIRNIFAKTVREAKEDEDLQAAFAKLAVEYTFTRLLPKSSFDPVEKIANSIATDLANELLRSRNISKSSLLEGKFEEIVQEILHANPAIMEEAQERHKAIKSLAKGLRLVAG